MKGAEAMYNITFQQIETFLTVSKYLSLSKAADAMFVSQPSLSMTLARLENCIGVSLFTRSNKGVALTNAGMYLYTALKPLYDNTEYAIRFVKDNMSPYIKMIHIAAPVNYDTSDEFLSIKSAITNFEAAHPSVTVIESLLELRELRQTLEYGGADLAIVPDFLLSGMTGITHRQAARFEFYIAMSTLHPLAVYAQTNRLTPAMLNGATLYAISAIDEAADRRFMSELCGKAGFIPGTLEFPPNYQTILHATRSGKGLSICLKFNGGDDIIYYPLKNLSGEDGELAVAWRADRLGSEVKSLLDLF
jgi:DNA-binding transcriptional LysR family regulator